LPEPHHSFDGGDSMDEQDEEYTNTFGPRDSFAIVRHSTSNLDISFAAESFRVTPQKLHSHGLEGAMDAYVKLLTGSNSSTITKVEQEVPAQVRSAEFSGDELDRLGRVARRLCYEHGAEFEDKWAAEVLDLTQQVPATTLARYLRKTCGGKGKLTVCWASFAGAPCYDGIRSRVEALR